MDSVGSCRKLSLLECFHLIRRHHLEKVKIPIHFERILEISDLENESEKMPIKTSERSTNSTSARRTVNCAIYLVRMNFFRNLKVLYEWQTKCH